MRILILEDEPMAHSWMKRTLLRERYEWVFTKTVEEFMEVGNAEHFDAYMLDYNVPGGVKGDVAAQRIVVAGVPPEKVVAIPSFSMDGKWPEGVRVFQKIDFTDALTYLKTGEY